MPKSRSLQKKAEQLEKDVKKPNFLKICQEQAANSGIDLEVLIWAIVKSMFTKAAKGNVNAARMLFDRFFGAVEKAPTVAVQQTTNVQQNTTVVQGPTPPTIQEFGAYLAKLNQVAESQGLLAEPLELEEINRMLQNDSGA